MTPPRTPVSAITAAERLTRDSAAFDALPDSASEIEFERRWLDYMAARVAFDRAFAGMVVR